MKPQEPKYYRILNDCRTGKLQGKNDNSPEKLTQQIVRNKNFVYIDINSENGLCQMQSIDPKQADQEVQKITGNTYICSVYRLPPQSQKTLDYVYKLQEIKKQKQKFKRLLKDQLNAMIKKREKTKTKKKSSSVNKQSSMGKSVLIKKNFTANVNIEPRSQRPSFIEQKKLSYSTINQETKKQNDQDPKISPSKYKDKVIFYKGMETKYLKQYLEKRQLQEINEKILQKQKLLIAKYGFTNQYESIIKQKSPIVRKNRKIILPQIKSSSAFDF